VRFPGDQVLHRIHAMEKAYLAAFLQEPQRLLKGTRSTVKLKFAADRHEYLLVSHNRILLTKPYAMSANALRALPGNAAPQKQRAPCGMLVK
jgi:hypothetical protein